MAAYLMENPVRTFESCMGDVGLGKPLFFPDIPPRTGYITLGDVGYIRSGSFWRSFNLLHTKDTMINNLGVPEGHEPFNLQEKDIQKSSIPPTMWVKSLREVDEDLSTYNRFYIFALRHWSVIGIGKGVFMHMPEESTHVKVTDAVVDEWKSLYHKNAKTWHKWTQTTLKITLDPQHLIVVTGYVQTPKWVIATAEGTGQFTMTYQTLRGASAEILEQSGHMEVMIRSGYGPPAMIDEYEGEGTILADGFPAVPPSISNHYPFVEGIDLKSAKSAKRRS